MEETFIAKTKTGENVFRGKNYTFFETQDYLRYKFKKAQRPLNEYRIRWMKESLIRHGFCPHLPIIINEKNEIVDGQARVAALKEIHKEQNKLLTITVFRVTEKDLPILKVAYLSQSRLRVKWDLYDYMVVYAEEGLEEYKTLLAFQKRYDLPVTAAIMLTGFMHVNLAQQFQIGEFVGRNWKDAERYGEAIKKLREVWPHAGKRNVIRALYKFLKCEHFDVNILVYKCKKYPGILQPAGTVEQYCEVIENAYNFYNQNPVKFRRYFDF
jgi:hypothetical protein